MQNDFEKWLTVMLKQSSGSMGAGEKSGGGFSSTKDTSFNATGGIN